MKLRLIPNNFGEIIGQCCSFQEMGFALPQIIASIAAFILVETALVSAQIVPDNTLPNNSIVTPTGNTFTITSGTEVGTNLFHSFDKFSVLTGQTADFNNNLSVQNIFTRVSGGNISTIDGIVKTNGTANLFLINPNGIIFGANAQLNIGGSFIGSTANSIRFADGSEFSAINPTAPSLLTINVPIGLQFGSNPGSIINQSQTLRSPSLPILPPTLPIPNNVGLAVQPGQTLALVGGDIILNSGNLTANTGQIILGSVASPGFVGFTSTPFGLGLNYDNITNFGNIKISGASFINTSGIGGGKVDIRGANVTISNGRIYGLTLGNLDGRGIDINAQNLLIQNGAQLSTLTLAEGKGGDINISATDSVEISGIGFDSYQKFLNDFLLLATFDPFSPTIVLETATGNSGASGNIEIDTKQFLMGNGAMAVSATLGSGNGGNIAIRANVLDLASSLIFSGTGQDSSGIGGNISFTGEQLIVRDGAILSTVTRSEQPSGNINIKASESVEVLRSPPGAIIQTVIASSSLDANGKGKAGDIAIDTKRLIAADGAGISVGSGAIIGTTIVSSGGPSGDLKIRASESIEVAGISEILANGDNISSFLASQTSSPNQGGNIDIATPILTLRDGGGIFVSSVSTGNAGILKIDASRIELIGTAINRRFISQIDASGGNIFELPLPNATGNAGSINLNVGELIIRDGARVSVRAVGTANAGNLTVVADGIFLDNQGIINASTDSGAGGNINLQAHNILLRRGSSISTNTNNTQSGNITINTDTLVAVPQENSDITANAQKGSGGRISITAQGIFGTEFRDKLTPESDITATSDLGPEFNGIVQIDIQGIDPNQGLSELPITLTDSSNQIAQSCSSQAKNNSFVVTGRGGLPPTPSEALNPTSGWIDWRLSGETGEVSNYQSPIPNPQSQISNPLVEATGWVIEPDGKVRLVAETSAVISYHRNDQQYCRGK